MDPSNALNSAEEVQKLRHEYMVR